MWTPKIWATPLEPRLTSSPPAGPQSTRRRLRDRLGYSDRAATRGRTHGPLPVACPPWIARHPHRPLIVLGGKGDRSSHARGDRPPHVRTGAPVAETRAVGR